MTIKIDNVFLDLWQWWDQKQQLIHFLTEVHSPQCLYSILVSIFGCSHLSTSFSHSSLPTPNMYLRSLYVICNNQLLLNKYIYLCIVCSYIFFPCHLHLNSKSRNLCTCSRLILRFSSDYTVKNKYSGEIINCRLQVFTCP